VIYQGFSNYIHEFSKLLFIGFINCHFSVFRISSVARRSKSKDNVNVQGQSLVQRNSIQITYIKTNSIWLRDV